MLLAAFFLSDPITKRKILGVMLGVAGAMLLIFQAGNASSGTNHMRGNNISGSQHYGLLRLSDQKDYPLSYLRSLSHLTREGVSVADIRQL